MDDTSTDIRALLWFLPYFAVNMFVYCISQVLPREPDILVLQYIIYTVGLTNLTSIWGAGKLETQA